MPTALLGAAPAAAVQSAVCPLAADFEAVGAARAFARRTARAWQLGPLIDDAALVTTELVSNALRHGLGLRPTCGPVAPAAPERSPWSPSAIRPGGSPPNSADSPGVAEDPLIELRLLAHGGRFVCAVKDPSDVGPVRRAPDLGMGSGRGLHLVDALSSQWGWTALRSEGRSAGKAVWALLSLDVVPPVAARAV